MAQAAARTRDLQAAGKRVVFTNGCFDLMHPGHVKTLAQARAEGDILIVGLNSDSSVRGLKGPTRPLLDQEARASVLLALRFVDFVVLFSEDTPADLIAQIKPDVLVKGGDWDENEIVGRATVERTGGRVVRIRPVPGYSTTAIIDKAKHPRLMGETGERDRPTVIGVIPARYGSTRFPGKPLAPIAGIPMVERVRCRAASACLLDRVVVATDDERIVKVIEAAGGEAMMTDPMAPSGTDRVIEISGRIKGDIFVNIQGDEPLLPPSAVDAAVEIAINSTEDTVVTLASASADRSDFNNPDVVKVVCREDGQALYFSRAPIPFPREGEGDSFLKHVGLYVFSRKVLQTITNLPVSVLESCEKLEQLRWMAGGIPVRVVPVTWDTHAVDRPEDIARVEAELAKWGDR